MVTRDDFKKLKQLDRIEYLLTKKHIEESNNYNIFSSFAYMFFFILGFMLLVFLGTANIVGIEKAIPIFNVMVLVSKIGVYMIVIAFFIDIIFWLRESIWKKQLREEYFKTETKPKK